MEKDSRKGGGSLSICGRIKKSLARGFHRLPRVVRFTLVIFTIQIVIFTLFRIIFWLAFHSTTIEVTGGEFIRAWYLGLKFDLRLTLLASLPFSLLCWLSVLNPIRSRTAKKLWLCYYVGTEVLFLLMYFVDFGHYDYLHTRLDVGVIDYLLSPAISATMVWETYPVVLSVLGLAVVCFVYSLLIRYIAFSELDIESEPLKKWVQKIVIGVFVLAYALGIYGKWSWYPLRWSDAYCTTDNFLAALALNPVLYFVDTLPNKNEEFDENEVRKHYDMIADSLEVREPDAKSLAFTRKVTPLLQLPGKPNVVLILLESFAAFKTGVFGNTLNPTPEFDAIAKSSILFTNFFVPTPPTARSVFTVLFGIPDVNPVRSASRNPRIVRQHTLVNALAGYEKLYFIGGSANWGNIRGMLAHNIPELRIYEEGDYEFPRVDVWGISDLHLFEAAHEVLKGTNEPFFGFIQTAGNHRPYTIPKDRKEFELAQVDREILRENGFDNEAAYNGMRFLDYSLGYFFRLARKEAYFKKTVFVLVADHGNPALQGIPYERLGLTSYHVPLVIYVPGYLKEARVVDNVASLVDVLPTTLDLIGMPYLNTTMGRSLLVSRPADKHFAFVRRGLLTDEFWLQISPSGTAHLYQYRMKTPTVDIREQFPTQTARLTRLYRGLLETAKYLLYHNPPRDSAQRH